MHCDKGEKLARNHFSRTTLQNVSRTSFYSCTTCEERRNELQQKVYGTKIKCDCPGGIHQAAREKCAIFCHRLRYRWPGKDCTRGKQPLTWDDVQFLNRLPIISKYSWWHKLLGRRISKTTSWSIKLSMLLRADLFLRMRFRSVSVLIETNYSITFIIHAMLSH